MISETAVMGCNSCGTRWVADQCCWMCGRPGIESPFRVTSQYGFDPSAVQEDVRIARRGEALLSADPCGGGPIPEQRAAS